MPLKASELIPFAKDPILLEGNAKKGNSQEDTIDASCKNVRYIGIILAIIEGLCSSLMSLCVKVLVDYDSLLLNFYDYVGLSLLSLIIVIYRKDNPFPKEYRGLLLGNTLCSCSTVITMFAASKLLPIGTTAVIIISTPIPVLFLARIFLKEKIDLSRVTLVLFASVGLIFISQPTFLFGETKEHLNALGLVVAFVCLFSFSCTTIFRRKLKDVHVSVTIFVYTTLASISCGAAVLVRDSFKSPKSVEECLYIFGIFLSHAGNIFADIIALKFEEANIVSICRLSDVVFAFLLQVFVFGELPDLFSIVGSIFVTAAIILIGIKRFFEENQ